MKCNQYRPGFELVSPCSFPTATTTTPRAPPNYVIKLSFSLYRYDWYGSLLIFFQRSCYHYSALHHMHHFANSTFSFFVFLTFFPALYILKKTLSPVLKDFKVDFLYKLDPLHSKHVVFPIDAQLSSNPI